MIVDFHTHTFPDAMAKAAVEKLQAASHTKAFTDATLGQLRASMDAAGIGYSLVLPVATSPRQVRRINDGALRIHETRRETGIDSLGGMHPDLTDWEEELERLAAAGIRGVKVHPPYQGVDFDDGRYLRILKKAAELDLLVVTHAGLDVGLPTARQSTPDKLRRAVDAVPDVTLVCAHMGGWRCWEQAAKLLADTPVYLDTAFSLGAMTGSGDGFYKTESDLRMLTDLEFADIVHAFGEKRILFGTDSPWGDQGADVSRIRALPLTQREKDCILGENAARLLRL